MRKNDDTVCFVLLFLIAIAMIAVIVIPIVTMAEKGEALDTTEAAVTEFTATEPEVTEVVEETEIATESPVTEPEIVEETEPATEAVEPVCEATEAPMPEETGDADPEVDPEELEMLACVIYQEAGGDACCDDCRYRVADIVLNRVASDRFPDTIYKVLTQKGQYGKFSSTGIKWPGRAKNSGEKHAVERAYEVAYNVLTDTKHSEVYGEGYIWQAGFKQGKDNIYCCGHYYGR